MALELISRTPEALIAAFQMAVEPLLYPSESDAPIEIIQVKVEEVGELLSPQDLERLFYSGHGEFRAEGIEWAEANRPDSNGTHRFFRTYTDIITTYPNNEYYVQEQGYRVQAPHWRNVRDLFFDTLVNQRWFRVNLKEPHSARADIFLAGRQLKMEEDPTTNETRYTPLDWVLLKTYVIET